MKQTQTSGTYKKGRPATTPEAREEQMIALAMDLAEKQLRDGTASSQIITEFLKRGSTKEKLEREILEKQKDLITAKTDSYKLPEKLEKGYSEVIEAIRSYSGMSNDQDI